MRGPENKDKASLLQLIEDGQKRWKTGNEARWIKKYEEGENEGGEEEKGTARGNLRISGACGMKECRPDGRAEE